MRFQACLSLAGAQGLVGFHAQGLEGFGRFSNTEMGLDVYPTLITVLKRKYTSK